MSTPAWKKKQRQEQHRREKIIREYKKKMVSSKSVKEEWKPLSTNRLKPVRDVQHVPSLYSNSRIDGTKVERKEYTGTLVKGIATMHKSNAVPVINDTEATDIANMRRN